MWGGNSTCRNFCVIFTWVSTHFGKLVEQKKTPHPTLSLLSPFNPASWTHLPSSYHVCCYNQSEEWLLNYPQVLSGQCRNERGEGKQASKLIHTLKSTCVFATQLKLLLLTTTTTSTTWVAKTQVRTTQVPTPARWLWNHFASCPPEEWKKSTVCFYNTQKPKNKPSKWD